MLSIRLSRLNLKRLALSRRARRRTAALVAFGIVALGGTAGATWSRVARESLVDDAAPGADAVVVLGCAVWQGGQPSPGLDARIRHGVQVWRETHARYLLVSGGLGQFGPAEATVMRRIAEAQGVPPAAIIDDPYAYHTEASAQMCGRIARRLGWRRVTIVSDPWHLARSREQFLDAGVTDVRQSPALRSPNWLVPALRDQYMARETAALMVYSITRLV